MRSIGSAAGAAAIIISDQSCNANRFKYIIVHMFCATRPAGFLCFVTPTLNLQVTRVFTTDGAADEGHGPRQMERTLVA